MSNPFNPLQGLVIVQVSIRGPKGSGIARLAVDTGATETTLSRRSLRAVGVDPAQLGLRTVSVITGSGVVAVPLVTLNLLDALGQQRSNFTVQAHTLPPGLPIDGVLGLDFFRSGRLVVDFRTGFVVLE